MVNEKDSIPLLVELTAINRKLKPPFRSPEDAYTFNAATEDCVCAKFKQYPFVTGHLIQGSTSALSDISKLTKTTKNQ